MQVDDGPEKIKASLHATADKYNGSKERVPDEELRIWQCAQSLLVCQRVNIPFANILADYFPTDQPRILRDFQRFLSLIEASALLHQYQRVRTDDNALIASIEDYSIAYQIGRVILAQTLKGISSKAEELLKTVSKIAADKGEDYAFTRKELGAATNWHYEAIRRYTAELTRQEYILEATRTGGKGGAIRYVFNTDVREFNILPSPEKLSTICDANKVTNFGQPTDTVTLACGSDLTSFNKLTGQEPNLVSLSLPVKSQKQAEVVESTGANGSLLVCREGTMEGKSNDEVGCDYYQTTGDCRAAREIELMTFEHPVDDEHFEILEGELPL